MKLLPGKVRNAGDKKVISTEEMIKNVDFNIFKFNNRPKPTNPDDIVIIGAFSEFGCEIVGAMYCIPEILRKQPGKYTIVVGWYGREYLYKHLVDEFWEIKEEFMWLREYARAFHNESKNLKVIEKSMSQHGKFVPSEHLGRMAIGVRCNNCNTFWGSIRRVEKCKQCESTDVVQSLFADVQTYKPTATRIPQPSAEKKELVQQYLGPNPVGIFARNRQCYGRNLQPEFYVDLIKKLEDKGYTPIWLGEKQSTLACPVDHIIDFSRMPESRDLELTLAIVSQLKFTIQFWTASTRLAALMGTPFILFESPDQIWGNGQEGYRLNLCTFGPKKLAICHYLNVYENNAQGIQLAERCIDELMAGNEEYVFGLLETEVAVLEMKKNNEQRIGSV